MRRSALFFLLCGALLASPGCSRDQKKQADAAQTAPAAAPERDDVESTGSADEAGLSAAQDAGPRAPSAQDPNKVGGIGVAPPADASSGEETDKYAADAPTLADATQRAADQAPAETQPALPVQRTVRTTGAGPLRVPEALGLLVARTQWPMADAYGDLLYEGNNKGMRGDAGANGVYFPVTGLDIAERWRAWGRAGRGVFLLRDSLWNQQDHVGRYTPVGLMLSPSWVTVAAHQASISGPAPRLGIPADPESDKAWGALSLEQLFGPFPPSDTLHEWATKAVASNDKGSAQRVVATRELLVLLDKHLASLAEVADQGPEAVAALGAEIICKSDRDYFTAELRRDKFIPLLVENPYPHELHDEGKSFRVSRRDVPDEIIALTRTTVLRRRLADGDIAIERYQLSDPAAVTHLMEVLRGLVPAGEDGNNVWIWVTGPVETEGKWIGPPALDYSKELDKALTWAGLNRDRVRVVVRTPKPLNSKTTPKEFEDQTYAHRLAGWTLRVNMRSAVVTKQIERWDGL